MMNFIETIELIPDSYFFNIEKKQYSSFFQTKEFYNFYANQKNIEPFYYAVEEKGEILASVCGVVYNCDNIIKNYLTKRAVIFGGPIFDENKFSINALEVLLEGTNKKLKNKAIYIEVRNLNDYSSLREVFKKAGYSHNDHLNFKISCLNREEVNLRISKSKKRQMRQSIKNGAKIQEAESIAQVKQFYSLLKELYLTKVKLPLPDKSFFIDFFKLNLGKYLLVIFQDKVVGGIMCPIHKKKTIYEWYICGEDGKYKGVYPSVLATMAPIEYAINHNIEIFDFMGAGMPDRDYGVREFKSKFGGDLVNHGRFLKINNPNLYKLGTQLLKIKKML